MKADGSLRRSSVKSLKSTKPQNSAQGWLVFRRQMHGEMRICVDLMKLNDNICREHHILPSVEQTLAQLAGATVYSKLNANSGFWQIKLHCSWRICSSHYFPHTFQEVLCQTPTLGITSAQENFQCRLTGVAGSRSSLHYGWSTDLWENKRRTWQAAVLKKIRKAGLTLNQESVHLCSIKVKYLG